MLQRYKDTKIQRYKDTKIQRYKDTKIITIHYHQQGLV